MHKWNLKLYRIEIKINDWEKVSLKVKRVENSLQVNQSAYINDFSAKKKKAVLYYKHFCYIDTFV